jgi:hypothetical protein
MLLIEDVVMNANDDTDGPIVYRSPFPDDLRTDNAPWTRRPPDDRDLFAPMPPPQQTIWPGL